MEYHPYGNHDVQRHQSGNDQHGRLEENLISLRDCTRYQIQGLRGCKHSIVSKRELGKAVYRYATLDRWMDRRWGGKYNYYNRATFLVGINSASQAGV